MDTYPAGALLRRSPHRRLIGLGIILCMLLVSAQFLMNASHAHASSTPDQRADQLIAQMTLDEKIALVHGVAGPYIGYVPANTRLGIPALNLENGPAGVADGMQGVTAFPAPVAGAASWDTALMNQAVVKQVTATTDGSGKLTLQFTSVIDNVEVSGIDIS